MRIIDLFSGLGGWSYGLTKANHTIVMAIDNWNLACKSYKMNFDHPNIIQTNILELDKDDLPDTDIIVGSPPCKLFSILNKHRTDDITLTKKFFEIVDNRPFIMENVSRVKKVLETKYSDIIPEGSTGKIITMANYNVPQIRRRYILSNFLDFDLLKRHAKKTDLSYFINKFKNISCTDKPHHSDRILKRIKNIQNGESYRGSKFSCYYRYPTTGIGWAVTNVVKNMNIHPTENRRLNVCEAKILQTFPENYKITGDVMSIAEQIANAVPPNFSYIIGQVLNEMEI